MQESLLRSKNIKELAFLNADPIFNETRSNVHILEYKKLPCLIEQFLTMFYSKYPSFCESNQSYLDFFNSSDPEIVKCRREFELAAYSKLWTSIICSHESINSKLPDKQLVDDITSDLFTVVERTNIKKQPQSSQKDLSSIFLSCLYKSYEDVYKYMARSEEFKKADYVFGSKIDDVKIFQNDFEFDKYVNTDRLNEKLAALEKQKERREKKKLAQSEENTEDVKVEAEEENDKTTKIPDIQFTYKIAISENEARFRLKEAVLEYNKSIISEMKTIIETAFKNGLDIKTIFDKSKKPLEYPNKKPVKETEKKERTQIVKKINSKDFQSLINPNISFIKTADKKNIAAKFSPLYSSLVASEKYIKDLVGKEEEYKFSIKNALFKSIIRKYSLAKIELTNKSLYKLLTEKNGEQIKNEPNNIIINEIILKNAFDKYKSIMKSSSTLKDKDSVKNKLQNLGVIESYDSIVIPIPEKKPKTKETEEVEETEN